MGKKHGKGMMNPGDGFVNVSDQAAQTPSSAIHES
jgi:hypothetical protein